MKRIRRQWGFLRSLLEDAQQNHRRDVLRHANADQINAVSELVMNTLKKRVPVTPDVVARLKKHKRVLREVAKRSHSVKKRRALLLGQKGRGLWQALGRVCRCLTR